MLFHHLLLIVSLCNKGNERKKASSFALHCTRFSVTLTSSKLLSLGNARKKASSFALHCTRFSVTLSLLLWGGKVIWPYY